MLNRNSQKLAETCKNSQKLAETRGNLQKLVCSKDHDLTKYLNNDDTIQVFVRVKLRSIHGLAHSNSDMYDRDPTIHRFKSLGRQYHSALEEGAGLRVKRAPRVNQKS